MAAAMIPDTELVQGNAETQSCRFPSAPMPCQPLGWFKKPITSADDFKGLKYRTVGLAADLMREMGTAVTILAGGEIVPALERGVIDGAEFNNPSSDSLLGFARCVRKPTCCVHSIRMPKASS